MVKNVQSVIRYAAYAAGVLAGSVVCLYGLSYLFGSIFSFTNGALIARYPALLEQTYAKHGQTYLSFRMIPQCAIDGTISVEDKRFFYSPGFDPIALTRVAFQMFNNDHQDHGGSTISEQLARIVIHEPRDQPSFPAELWSELRVLKYTLVIEHDFSKDKILELYLNGVYYGRKAQGFAAAAKTYFNTAPANLSPAECYYLTGLPQAPSYFGSDPAAAAARYRHVLATLKRNGFITSAEEQRLASSTPVVNEATP